MAVSSYQDLLVWQRAMHLAAACYELTRDYLRFLRIAQGSLKELETHLLLAVCIAIPAPNSLGGILPQADELGRMLRALHHSVNRAANQSSASTELERP